MNYLNMEIKAMCSNPAKVREILKIRKARFKGIDHQVDTYFKVNRGRLKLREGNIENSLIFYERENVEGPKRSDVILYKEPAPAIKEVLSKALGVLVVVDKEREIYFIENVKFHIDTVQWLGTFIEIEAIDKTGTIGETRLLEQCCYYLDLFGIAEQEMIACSYSDLFLRKGGLAESC